MRLFTAFPVPQEVRESVVLETASMRGAYPGLKWIGMDALHITLVFLGEVRDDLAGPICSVLQDAAATQPCFQIKCRGLGTFPPRGTPRVMFLRIEDGGDECRFVQSVLRSGLSRIMNVENRRFTPHLTIARVKDSPVWPDVRHDGTNITAAFPAERIVLYRSHLKKDGAVYEEIFSAGLGAKEDS